MKKSVFILFIYTLAVFIGCIIFGFTGVQLPRLIPGDVSSYKWLSALYTFFSIFPAIILSGFIAACSIQWKTKTENSRKRFSPAMIARFKSTLIVSLFIVLFLSLNQEVFLPSVENSLAKKKTVPYRLINTISSAQIFLFEENYNLALQYANMALEMDPQNNEARVVLKNAQDALELIEKGYTSKDEEQKPPTVEEQKTLHTRDAGYTILQLVQKSKAAFEQEDYLNSHYYAELAVKACSGTDSNLQAAIELLNASWNEVQKPHVYEDEPLQKYYDQKRKGYTAFNSGDSLKAYYIFQSLLSYDGVNPTNDVQKFFELAREDVENQYFFFDETERMNELPVKHDVYFALSLADGSKDIVYMRGAIEIKKEAGLVWYIQDLSVVNFNKNGKYNYSFSVPYAKIIAQSTSVFSPEARRAYNINDKWKNVPLVIMQSVDRKTEGLVCRPEYDFSPLCKDQVKRNIAIIPMNFTELSAVTDASTGLLGMNLFSLMNFLPKAKDLGFSQEVFSHSLICRILYPLFALIMLILCAIAGWNYRIEAEDAVFKFRWIFVIPITTVFMMIIYRIALYIFNLMNHVLIGVFQGGAMFMAWVFYIIVFAAVSLVFMSRKK